MPTSKPGPLYMDDLIVGQKFPTRSHTIDVGQITAFAREFDPQPFHVDEKAAEGSFFKGLAASGWHVAALTMRLLVEDGPHIAGGVIGAGGEIQWPHPTRPGDVLTVVCEILAITPSKSRPERGGMVTMRNTTTNQRGEAVYVFTVNALAPRRPATA